MKTKRFLSLFLCIAMTLSVLTGVTTNDRAAEEKRLDIANGNIYIEAGVEGKRIFRKSVRQHTGSESGSGGAMVLRQSVDEEENLSE